MMFCPQCGHKNPDDYNFCPYCGADLRIVRGQAEVSAKMPAAEEDAAAQEALLRERLFSDGIRKDREDVRRWIAFHLEHDRAPDLSGAKLKGLKLECVDFLGSDLQMADLHRADLRGANLFFTNLQGANLSEAYLFLANLQEADLDGANLTKANLQLANLIRANLRMVNLRGVNLKRAKLLDANMLEANLQGAEIVHADFNENTILPDGSRWTPETDLDRFINPAHSGFWRSGNPQSPAYRQTH